MSANGKPELTPLLLLNLNLRSYHLLFLKKNKLLQLRLLSKKTMMCSSGSITMTSSRRLIDNSKRRQRIYNSYQKWCL